MSALRARCQDARVYSSILNNKRREKMIVCHCGLWGMWAVGPNIAKIRYFTPNPFSRNENWTFINVHF